MVLNLTTMYSRRSQVLDINRSVSIEEYGFFLSNSLHDTLTHIIINNRRDVLVKYIQTIIQTFNFKSVLFHTLCDNHWMFYRLAITGCLREYPQEELWKVVYKMKNIYLTHLHLSMNEIYDMQDCFHYLNTILLGWTIKIKHFLNIMSSLRERRLRIAKKKIYYFVIKNVICNPDHPIGRRLILKEYYTSCSCN